MNTTAIKPFAIDAPFDEVADSLADALEVIQASENALQDGLQIGDAFVALAQEKPVREIINDAPEAANQVRKLTPITSLKAVTEACTRLVKNGRPIGKITRFAINAVYSSGTGYSDSLQVLAIVQRQIAEKQDLIAGKDIFPGFLEDAA